MQVWVLVGQFPARRLRPHHEGVHGPLHMRLVLASRVHSHWHWHDGPVVAVEYLTHCISDFDGETLVLVIGLSGRAAGGGVVHPGRMRLLWPEQGRVSSSGRARGVSRRQWTTVIRHPRTEVGLRKALLLSGHLSKHKSLQVCTGGLTVANRLFRPVGFFLLYIPTGTHGESAWSLSDLSLWPPLSYNINCQSVSTLNLRSKTLWGFHIKVLSIRVVGIIGGSVRTLDPSLPASRKPPAPNPPGLTALSVFTSVNPTTELQRRRPETVEWWDASRAEIKTRTQPP